MNNIFHGPSWIAGAKRMDEIRENWESRTYDAAQADSVSAFFSFNEVDASVKERTATLKLAWYDLIGNLGVALGSDSSKMMSTGKNYSDTEEQAVEATTRFWEDR